MYYYLLYVQTNYYGNNIMYKPERPFICQMPTKPINCNIIIMLSYYVVHILTALPTSNYYLFETITADYNVKYRPTDDHVIYNCYYSNFLLLLSTVLL